MSLAGKYAIFELGDDRHLPFVVVENGELVARVANERFGLRLVAMLIADRRQQSAFEGRVS